MSGRPLEEGPFRLLLGARAVSALGDRLVPVALAFAVLDLTGSVSDLGIVIGAQTAALLVFVLLGGVWADRLPRRRVMLAADGVRMLAQGASAALLLSGEARIWQLAALQVAYGAAEGFFVPASVAIVPETVEPASLQQANAMLGLTDNTASVLGPATAGVLVATAGAGWGLAADAVTFALSGAMLLALRLPARTPAAPSAAGAGGGATPPMSASSPVPPTRVLSELKTGWRAFRSRTWLWTSVLYFTLYIGFAYAPYQVLGPQIAKTDLGGPGAWAAISAALGVGAICGGLAGLRWKPRHPLRAVMLVFLVSGPALLVLLGLHAPLPALVVAALVDGAASSLFNAFWLTAQQSEIPAAELSRVSSWDYLGSLVLAPAGLAITGPVAVAVGLSTTLYGAAAIALLLTVAILLVPAVRNFAPTGPAAAGTRVRA